MSVVITPIKPIEIGKISKFDELGTDMEKSGGFDNILSEAIKNTREMQSISDKNNYDLSMGDVEDLSRIQVDALKAQTMLQTTVQLTSRTVNAYKEIMQMQV